MRKFPRREADVVALARQIIHGLTVKADVYPSPPLDPAELRSLLDAYKRALEATIAARAAATVARKTKDAAFKDLVEGMKAELRYAEHAARYDNAKLMPLGWSGRKEPTPLSVPGAATKLEVKREGPGWVSLSWRKPKDGGTVATYLIQVSHVGRRDWRTAGLCFETATVVKDQERGVELEYRVVAINKAGEGLPSNTVTVLL